MPRNKYPEETVKKILDVSLRLFLEKGYEQTTILDIVNNLGGLTRGAFYHHFKSKEEVLDALGNKLLFENNPFEKVKDEKGLSGLKKIEKAFRIQLERQKADKEYMDIIKASLTLLKSPRFLIEHLEWSNKIAAQWLQPLIEEGIADGSIKDMDAKALSELMLLLTNFWFIPSVFPCNKQEFVGKVALIKNVFDNLGFKIFDLEFLQYSSKIFDEMDIK